MACKACLFDALEHIDEINRAGARMHVEFVFTVVIGDPHLVTPLHAHTVDEAGDANWVVMRMINREGPLQLGRLDLIKVPNRLFKIVRQLVNFR